MPLPRGRMQAGLDALPTRFPGAGGPWRFTMVSASAETVAAFLHAVAAGPRGFSTLRVWNALAPYVRRDTAELTCTQRTLAQTAGVSRGDVQRALERLVEMGALLRDGRGQYRVHPAVMWRGELALRGQAEADAPMLTLIEGGKVE